MMQRSKRKTVKDHTWHFFVCNTLVILTESRLRQNASGPYCNQLDIGNKKETILIRECMLSYDFCINVACDPKCGKNWGKLESN